jgi:antitoxin PrlF
MPDDSNTSAIRTEAAEGKRAWVKVGPGGRIVIPAAVRRALRIVEGEHVQVQVRDGELRLVPRDIVYSRVQDANAERIPPGVSLVDQLIEERRLEVERDGHGE